MSSGTQSLAFGVDPIRRERFSLRQSRYYSLAEDISRLCEAADRDSRRLRLLDVGVQDGVSRRYIEAQPHTSSLEYSGADLSLREQIYRREGWRDLFVGDLMEGYPQIPSESYDIVICEQVLEHLPHLPVAMQTLSRVLKPGGTLFVGVPTYPHGAHLIRKHLVPWIDSWNPRAKVRGHVQAFSLYTFQNLLRRHAGVEVLGARGFRMISGGMLRPLENQEWWWRMNRALGAAMPGLCIEIQVVARKPLAAATAARIRRAA